jgi:hypothetical protein
LPPRNGDAVKNGGGPPLSETLESYPAASKPREASWSAPAFWSFDLRAMDAWRANLRILLETLIKHSWRDSGN